MENEQMQQPTYEQLAQGYQQLLKEFQRALTEVLAMRQDKTLEKLNSLMHIIEEKEKYSTEIVSLANQHILKIMEFPKE